ncbi:MAG: helix-turn-helix domain-containing protein [Sedimentisphaerales bacterium]|nr:helix-turn-helix domain-containing protein [Sedimentisphaerales bacterium]
MSKSDKITTCQVEPLMLRAAEAARLCGLAVSTWYELKSAGRLPPSIKIGKARLWRMNVLRKWVGMDCPSIDKFEAMEKKWQK